VFIVGEKWGRAHRYRDHTEKLHHDPDVDPTWYLERRQAPAARSQLSEENSLFPLNTTDGFKLYPFVFHNTTRARSGEGYTRSFHIFFPWILEALPY
jgi:hypothetical protein